MIKLAGKLRFWFGTSAIVAVVTPFFTELLRMVKITALLGSGLRATRLSVAPPVAEMVTVAQSVMGEHDAM